MISQAFTVQGMTCQHCVAAVTEEVHTVPGVRQVMIDLASGGLTVLSDQVVDPLRLRAAVEEAGYELVASVESPMTYR